MNVDVGEILPANHFNLPKLHSLLHYVRAIIELGTSDNYNTETTERLHIDYAKDAYRAGNHKDFVINMTTWLTCMEKMDHHSAHIAWLLAKPSTTRPIDKPLNRLQLTKCPSSKAVTITTLAEQYHAPRFLHHLQHYLRTFIPPSPSPVRNQVSQAIDALSTRPLTFPVFHQIRILNHPTQDVDGIADRKDAIHVSPAHFDKKIGAIIRDERFDTLLVEEKDTVEDTGIQGV